MILSEITAAMQAWSVVRNNATALQNLFRGKNGFEIPANFEIIGEHLHVYPGVVNNELYFFLIPAYYDNIVFKQTIANRVIACQTSSLRLDPITKRASAEEENTSITENEASTSIGNWTNYSESWMESVVTTSSGMYKSFLVPMSDIEHGNQHSTFFALKGDDPTFVADLVTRDQTNGNFIGFYDLARPVPPFGSSGTASSLDEFYLLSLI
ncbi:MAG: hypothetical protein MK066_02745 [Crocinitomicaceae bacterium]|nr:hypothetical protein [Crocinitomicaceae bacterium]